MKYPITLTSTRYNAPRAHGMVSSKLMVPSSISSVSVLIRFVCRSCTKPIALNMTMNTNIPITNTIVRVSISLTSGTSVIIISFLMLFYLFYLAKHFYVAFAPFSFG